MPKQSTGNPRGRPKGSGQIGTDQVRFTVRLPHELYNRLEAFTEGRYYTRGAPKLAVCVREAIEQYLPSPNKRQTRNISLALEENNRQTENIPKPHEDNNGQTKKSAAPLDTPVMASEGNNGQTISEKDAATQPKERQNKRQTEKGSSTRTAAKRAIESKKRQTISAPDTEAQPAEPQYMRQPKKESIQRQPGRTGLRKKVTAKKRP